MAKRRSRVREISFVALVVVRRDREFLLTRRPSEGLLGGLWEFPSTEVAHTGEDLETVCRGVAEAVGVELQIGREALRPLQPVKHVFSHLKAVYRPLLARAVGGGGWSGGLDHRAR